MRKYIFSLLVLGASWSPCLGQNKKLNVYFNTLQFQAPEIGNYLELHFQFNAKTVKFIKKENGLQATVLISIELKDSTLKSVFKDEYALQSPQFLDSTVEDFYELRRIPLAPSKYQIFLKISDFNVKNSELKATQLIDVEDYSKLPRLSQIEAIELAKADTSSGPFQKNGFFLLPRSLNYYGTDLSKLPIYFEINNLSQSKDSVFYLEQELTNALTDQRINGFFMNSEVLEKEDVLPFIRNLDITNLPSGAYNLSLSLKDQSGGLIHTQNMAFERGNFLIEDSIDVQEVVLNPDFQKSITEDSIYYFLASLIPLSKGAENIRILKLLKSDDHVHQRKYIQAFWIATRKDAPYEAWIRYKQQVQHVQKIFKTNFQPGYQTDRGRVYLQYGAPNSINARENSPTEYPYEIWIYDKIGKFSNRRFIFYNPDLANNNYTLLHSDLIGEVKRNGWSQVLSKRNTTNGSVDDPNLFNQRHWGQNSNDLFRQY